MLIGNGVAASISRFMLNNELNQVFSNAESFRRQLEFGALMSDAGFPPLSISNEKVIEMFEVSLTVPTIIVFYLIGLGATSLAAILPGILILKIKPMKILK